MTVYPLFTPLSPSPSAKVWAIRSFRRLEHYERMLLYPLYAEIAGGIRSPERYCLAHVLRPASRSLREGEADRNLDHLL